MKANKMNKFKLILIISIIMILNMFPVTIATSTVNNTKQIPGTEIIISDLTLNEGETGRIARAWTPTNTTDTIEWSSSNPKVATIDQNGNVTAIKKGRTKIKAKLNEKAYAICTVKVKNNSNNNNSNNKNENKSENNQSKSTTKNTKTEKARLNGHNVGLPAGDDRVYFLDVTDYRRDVRYNYDGSDAIILESNGKYGMIDTGIDYQGNRVARYLKDIGATNLEFILITHAHVDHYGGFNTIINSGIKVKKLYIKDIRNGKSDRIYAYRNIVRNARAKNIPIYDVSEWSNQRFTLEDFSLSLYNTNDQLRNKASEVGENVNSIATLAQIHSKKIYFSGDIESDPDINCYPDREAADSVGQVDIYKFAHHSYPTYNYESILKKLNPKYGVVTNQRDRYGTVRYRRIAIERTRISSSRLYYTGNGTVILTIGEDGKISFNQLSNDG